MSSRIYFIFSVFCFLVTSGTMLARNAGILSDFAAALIIGVLIAAVLIGHTVWRRRVSKNIK